jgi:multisubunit Na+/H+ antiporter MnhB subunit
MKHITNHLVLFAGRIDRRHIQLAMLVFSLCLLFVGVNTPIGGGEGGPGAGGI